MRATSIPPNGTSKTVIKKRPDFRARVVAPTLASLLIALTFPPAPLAAQPTSPEEHFGFPIGTDYELLNYEQLTAYWRLLADQSDRMTLSSIGKTEEGRDQWMATITSPSNRPRLDRYKEIARSLALAKGANEDEARALAREGKAVVWIDGGLHATEVLGIHQLMELVWQMVSREDAETLRFLDDVILLATHANPDGHDLVSNWYMRTDERTKRSTRGVPALYQKYAGHDNNRDFYMSALAETENMNRVMYREWFPQIVYNHHQTGPAGTVMFAPPFRDPPNHNLDPIIITSLDQVGSAIHHRMVVEGKGGTTMRRGASYSTWWNGGLRTTPYFHNMIGLLTETIGHPTPIEIPFLPRRQIGSADLPMPVEPGPWRFRQSVDYSQTANRAVLDYASRNREHLLFNIWRMGANSIERGSGDSWTVLPKWIDDASIEVTGPAGAEEYRARLREPGARDARGYILPSDQRDFPTAERFVNALLKNGIEIHRARAAFSAGAKTYPADSYVVRMDQAFRPHILDMFEPQNHPNDFLYPGGPPISPYDNAGWTLALQMGVDFDRVFEDVRGDFASINEGLVEHRAGFVSTSAPYGYLLDRINHSFVVVNRIAQRGGKARWITDEVASGGVSLAPGAFYVEPGETALSEARAWAEELGVSFRAASRNMRNEGFAVEARRIALLDRYGGSMPSGWIRHILEDFEFEYDVLFPPDLERGGLEDYDVLIMPDGFGISVGARRGGVANEEFVASLPDSLRGRIGSVSGESVTHVREFLERGGILAAIGSAARIGEALGIPVEDHMVDSSGTPLPRGEYFTPGSIHSVGIHHGSPILHGLGDRAFVLHSHSPVFRVADHAAGGVRVLATYDSPAPLVSGWAWGQERLEGGASMIEADVGRGKAFLFGPKITFRAQSHGTFALLFNAIFFPREAD